MNGGKSLIPLRIISFAMHFSILIYVFIVFFLSQTQGWPVKTWGEWIQPDFQVIFYVLVGVAVFNGFLTVIVPLLFSPRKPDSTRPVSLFFDFKNFTPRMFTQTILRLAFSESVAILGFVLAFLNQSPWLIVPFAVVALILQVVFAPWFQWGDAISS